jgi:hypothetical protein
MSEAIENSSPSIEGSKLLLERIKTVPLVVNVGGVENI